jgi:mannosyl-oligosaccharide alpha-1,2-mannosidase
MPEEFFAIPCDNPDDCPWNQTRWLEAVNPSLVQGPGQSDADNPDNLSSNSEGTDSEIIFGTGPSKRGLPVLPPRGMASVKDRRYLLRPEAIESVWILYRITGDKNYQEAAWNMFRSVCAATETDLANSAVDDVMFGASLVKSNSMESFWLAETLKYFYLVFSEPEVGSLDDFVYNTEAPPLRRPKKGVLWGWYY